MKVLKRPLITEKSALATSEDSKYTFEIPSWATKNHVKEAFAKYFPDHKVLKVNVSNFGRSKEQLAELHLLIAKKLLLQLTVIISNTSLKFKF